MTTKNIDLTTNGVSGSTNTPNVVGTTSSPNTNANVGITTVTGNVATPTIQASEDTPSVVANPITPAISASVQELLVAVKLKGYGEEEIPDPTLFKRADDYQSTIDTISKVLTKVLPTDSVSATEVIAKFIQPGKQDTVTVSELITFVWNIVRIYNDTVAPTELITFTWNALRSYTDTVTATESKVANIQTYFQADFVQPGYVGTNITL